MGQLTANCDSSLVGTESLDAEFVRTELELAFSVLDVAAVTETRKIVRRCMRNALAALRTATRFLANAADNDGAKAEICQRCDELLKRVREIARQRRTRESNGPDGPAVVRAH